MQNIYIVRIKNKTGGLSQDAFTSAERAFEYVLDEGHAVKVISLSLNGKIVYPEFDIKTSGSVRTMCHKLQNGLDVIMKDGGRTIKIQQLKLNPKSKPVDYNVF